MTIPIAGYLGRDITDLLKSEPFSRWGAVRSVETDSTHEVRYEFEEHGVEVICDLLNRIQTIFVHPGDGAALVDVPFRMGRKQVLERFGPPAESGGPVRLAGIGEKGAWDRFPLPEGVLHIQYATGRDEIDLITLFGPDVMP